MQHETDRQTTDRQPPQTHSDQTPSDNAAANQSAPNSRMLWLGFGVAAGLCIAYFWPSEPVQAVTNDRNDKFAMATVEVQAIGSAEGVFVLDFLTGKLQGHVLNNRTGIFTHGFVRNIAADFGLDPKAKPVYAIVSGRGNLPAKGRTTTATGVIYIAELTSGQCIAYAFPYNDSRKPVADTLYKVDAFQFREPLVN